MDLQTILSILQLAGTETPAFVALFKEVQKAFGADDQASLAAMLVQANNSADAQHEAAQEG